VRPSGRGDKAFTDAALAGLDAATRHGRLAVVERLPTQADEYGATIDQLAADGPDLIVGVGFLYREAFLAASVRHPQLRFLLLGVALPNRPNVQSVTFRADEGSFLAGVVAAAESKRGAVGFIGGMTMPTVQAFECGFETGVRFAAKQIGRSVKGYAVYIGTTPEAPRTAALRCDAPRRGRRHVRPLRPRREASPLCACRHLRGVDRRLHH
jgi:basic membrane protein A